MKKYYLLFFVFALYLQGCGLWTDFKTYFNLYYNTTDLFEQAETSIYEQNRDLFSTEELTLPGTANTQLVKVIEKCSQILQFHSTSSYVDNALLIIGKSFYYQKNYQKGLRKFQELIATQPESSLLPDARLWIGKSLMRLKEYESGLQTLREVRAEAIEEGEGDFIKESFVEEIVYWIIHENYQQAIELSNRFLEVSKDNSIKAEVNYELGLLYNKVDDPVNAVSAFDRVFNFSPSYEIELKTRLEKGRTLRLIGENQNALELFEKMKSEAKFSDVFNEIDLEIGITFIELGDYQQAVEKLTYVDTAYTASKTSGIAKYKLGEIYQYNLVNFDSAGAYYQKSVTSPSTEEYTYAASQKTRMFRKYQQLKLQINNGTESLFYIQNPEEYTKDSLAYVQDSIAFAQDSLRILEELDLYTSHLQLLSGLDDSPDILFNLDSLRGVENINLDSLLAYSPSFLDSLMALDSLTLDTLGIAFNTLDSLRILDSIKTASEKPFGFVPDRNLENINTDSLFRERLGDRERVMKPIKSELSEDSLKSIIVKNQLELGNLFMIELSLPDSAYHYYNDIIFNYPNTIYHASALYALGSYYLTIDNRTTADSLFNHIYENYRNESIVNVAADKLNKPLIDLDYDPAKDLYFEAENELLKNNYAVSLEKFYNVFQAYPKSTMAPKALYASGWILENELNLYDSAAVVYDTMAFRYPQSEFTVKIRPKLANYKKHKEEMQRAIEDSLRLIDQQEFSGDEIIEGPDTLATDDLSPEIEDAFIPKDEEIKIDELTKEKLEDKPKSILNDPGRNPRRK